MADSPEWSIHLFGGLRVVGPETHIDRFPTRRSALLLARVALSRNGSISRDELANTLWPDDFLDATRLRLRQELNRLRETLGPASVLLLADRSWVRLDLERSRVDAREFERTLALARAEENPARRVKLRSDAIAQYEGPLLADQSETWIDAERQDLQAKYLQALIEQSESLLEQGVPREALATALKAVRADPFFEPARRASMGAFAALGDLGGALRQYAEYEKSLQREFNIRPSDALQQFVADLAKESAATPVSAPAPAVASKLTLSPAPVFLERMIGREAPSAQLKDWLTGIPPARLVVVTGPGGVGKTRLAAAAATDLAQEFEGNVVFAALADLEPGQRVRSKIQSAFGIQGVSAEGEPLPQWGGKPCLLILDNAEHLIDDVRREVKEILLTHPAVSILATSRQKLGIGGERELPLTPLEVPDLAGGEPLLDRFPATELFLDRARAIRPDYQIPADQIEPFVLLLERLDGLPLAIELAAARVAFMSPEQMLQEIDDRFTFLVSRRSDVEPRQRSLRATIDWSFRGLDEDLKDVLFVLSAFRGGCTLELVKKAAQRSDAIEVMQDLVERSLVHREESSLGIRFNMLEAIRHYVQELVEPERLAQIRSDHAHLMAEYLFRISRNLDGEGGDARYETIRLEMDNALAAVDWAVVHHPATAATLGASLWRFWTARGRPRDGAEVLDRILANPPEILTADYAEACLGRGAIAATLGQHGEGSVFHERSLDIYEKLDNAYGIGWASMNLTFSLLEVGKNEEAVQLARKILKTKDPDGSGYLLHALGRALPRLGKAEEGMAAAEEAFACWVARSEPLTKGRAYFQLATAYSDCGRMEGVHGLLTQAIEYLRISKVQNFLIRAVLELAKEELRRGRLDEYAKCAAEARELAHALGDSKAHSFLDAFAARHAAMEGDLSAMARNYEAALMAAGASDRVADSLAIAIMAAHDLAHSEVIGPARTIVGAMLGLRDSTRCGLTPSEVRELSAVLEVTGEVEPAKEIHSGKDLAIRVLTATAEFR